MTQQTNQREIRFRAWDGEKMLYSNKQHFFFTSDFSNIQIPSSTGHEFYDKNYPFNQFIGIQDVNNKDVYEGDKTHDGVIEFNTETCCYIIRRANGTFIRLDVRKKDLEIIGNIHENNELLNQ